MTDKMRRLGLWLTDVDIPPPDYSDSDDQQDDVTDEELIAAKKLVNPCLESKEYKALRRELKLNQKLYVVNELCQLLNQSPIPTNSLAVHHMLAQHNRHTKWRVTIYVVANHAITTIMNFSAAACVHNLVTYRFIITTDK